MFFGREGGEGDSISVREKSVRENDSSEEESSDLIGINSKVDTYMDKVDMWLTYSWKKFHQRRSESWRHRCHWDLQAARKLLELASSPHCGVLEASAWGWF